MEIATQPIFTFNKTIPQLGKTFPQPLSDDFPTIQFKYASFEHAYKNTTDYVRDILTAAPVKNKHKHVVVDIKITDIEKNKPPCLPGWHCDTVIDPFNETQPENHYLFVSGQASLTEFIGSPITLEVDAQLKQQKLLASFREQIDNIEHLVWKMPSCQLGFYGRFHFHRGSIGLFDEKRLLVRITETDILLPRNRPIL